MTTINPLLLELLRCPICIAEVIAEPSVDDPQLLRCQTCGRGYPVRDGIPVMLVDEAAGPE